MAGAQKMAGGWWRPLLASSIFCPHTCVTMASNTAAPPVALHPDNLPDDLVCSICLTVPADPLVTPCDHVFCRACICQALNHNNLCPIDRRPCCIGELNPLEGLSFRIWSGIQVKCGGHESGCAWRGSIADYSAHVENNCGVGRNPTGQNNNNNLELTEEVETLRVENLELKEQLEDTNQTLRGLRIQMMWEAARSARLQEERESLLQSRDALQEHLDNRPSLPIIFNGSYDFGRENICELSKLISIYYLNEITGEIDGSRIYNCVQSCYTALDRNYQDNPEDYWYDMRMLLATCLASPFFTVNQWNNIDSWYRKHFGRYDGP
eukprot:scaffold5572_cov83-Skeletonema_dohrnii-CCMP3373.AAC.7